MNNIRNIPGRKNKNILHALWTYSKIGKKNHCSLSYTCSLFGIFLSLPEVGEGRGVDWGEGG